MKTALYDRHAALGAKMAEFAGWEMPIQYQGVVHEHNAVRNGVGIFDVSHMGRIDVAGVDAERFVDYICTNKIAGKKDMSAIYSVMADQQGGSVDDIMVYRYGPQRFSLVVNAGNRDKDLHHIGAVASAFDVAVVDHYDDGGIVAIQGPDASDIVGKLFPEVLDLKPMRFVEVEYQGSPLLIATTGYTGAGGFEFCGCNATIIGLWDAFVDAGAEPIGLAARDTLRMEMGFALYGHELADTIASTESVASWVVKLNKDDFLGKDALVAIEAQEKKRKQYGVVLRDRGIARQGCVVQKDGDDIGIVTSGTFAPSLNKAIAIIMVDSPLKEGDTVDVMVRNKGICSQVVALPFYRPAT